MPHIIGIRREDKNRWERRVPLVPADLGRLAREDGLDFIVQPSPIRTYKDEHFAGVGCRVEEDLSPAKVVFAVKEIPLDLLEPETAYVFFAHVIKGQAYNMPLLQRLLDLRCTLIDYERIADAKGRRLVFFGREAGQAGMIETFHALDRRLRWEGFDSPFQGVKQAYAYSDLEHAKRELRELGLSIRAGIDPDLAPMVVGFAGYGNVSRGAQEIFDLFPHDEVEPGELAALFSNKQPPRDRLYKVVFREEDMVLPVDRDADFDLQDYYANPEHYRGRFADYLPYLSALVNCIYWTERYPRLISRADARSLWSAGRRNLRVVGDISCDIDGSIEFTTKATEPDRATFVYDPISDGFKDGVEGRGIVDMAVDNLPCELPRDASNTFSAALRGFVAQLARTDFDRPFAQLGLPPELARAVVTHQGALTPDYRYLEEFLGDD
ncbi:MAG: bifunctional lysine ketoglutarate reductase /saccharopine dehydrogenase family protein [Candidatus Krumholzibacteriia bacterium]|nr:hypothetical protein [bacterium]MCB9513011.1 hypothetical protein [Candidatus Latescibacterota bacterium]MCB9516330.1 hypothetical protein [Candidatus Latescibacterota bacterium]